MKLVYLGYNPKTGRVEWTDQDAGIVMAESEVVPYRNSWSTGFLTGMKVC